MRCIALKYVDCAVLHIRFWRFYRVFQSTNSRWNTYLAWFLFRSPLQQTTKHTHSLILTRSHTSICLDDDDVDGVGCSFVVVVTFFAFFYLSLFPHSRSLVHNFVWTSERFGLHDAIFHLSSIRQLTVWKILLTQYEYPKRMRKLNKLDHSNRIFGVEFFNTDELILFEYAHIYSEIKWKWSISVNDDNVDGDRESKNTSPQQQIRKSKT